MAAYYFVMIPTPGAERRWPEDGMPLIRTKAADQMTFGWVADASCPEEAVARFIEYDESIGGDLIRRARGSAQVMAFSDQEVVKVKL